MNILSSFNYTGVIRCEKKSNPNETIVNFRYETVADILRKCTDLVGFENVVRIALEHHEMNIMNDMQEIFNEAQRNKGIK